MEKFEYDYKTKNYDNVMKYLDLNKITKRVTTKY